jgi:hypothetical protein
MRRFVTAHANTIRNDLREESLLDTARRALAENGLPRFTVKLVKKLLSPLLEFGSVRFIEFQLDENLFAGEVPAGFVLRQGDPSDMDSLIEALESSRTAAALEEKFRKRHLCFLMIDSQGRGARCSWAIKEGSEYIPELDMDLVLGPGEGYMFDAYTRSDLRHRGIDLPARTFVIRTLAQAGLKRSYGYVGSGSCRAALRGALRLGKPSGRVWYLRLRGCRTIVLGKRGLARPTLVPAGDLGCRVRAAA